VATQRNLQNDLFGEQSASLAVDDAFSTAKRVELDAQSWLEIVPGWVSESGVLFDVMRDAIAWQQHDRRLFDKVFTEPRLTASLAGLRNAPHALLNAAASALSRRYERPYDSLWLNYYRHGEDSTSWHRDRPACRLPECIVPVLSLGAARRFLVKPYRGGKSLAFRAGAGDLIVMGGRAQKDWVHSVPKEPQLLEGRISINFQSSAQGGPGARV
jgi:alkylated DNA repair dioxygenase AlkB